ncbi:hypothetical protein WK78_09560 [Burkholderia cepacia]|nr:hypothetical protein WK78_09560 [Burkholderia cepacia]
MQYRRLVYGEVADKLPAALGRPFSRSVWSEQYLLDELARDPNNMMRKYRAAFAQGRGVACDGDLLACGARLIASQDQTGG